jgi:flavin-dependent dehydrogenase
MGGFGISRYSFDNFLYTVALSKGAEFRLNTAVVDIRFENERFYVMLSSGEVVESLIAIGSFGKRSNLDRQLNRKFFSRKSPYIAVKYHIKTDFPKDLIALHNFKDGYCGISKVEGDNYCLCYMTTRENLKSAGSIVNLEEKILYRNPYLREIFTNSQFVFEKPEVINEISFDSKTSIENHLFLSGDAAGMITPLCGNGMAMAIHSAKILSSLILRTYRREGFNRMNLESQYEEEWKKMFETRLYIGRKIQQLFGKEFLTDLTVKLLKSSPPLGKWIVRQTHGQPF